MAKRHTALTTDISASSHSGPGTAEVAAAAYRDHGLAKIIKAAELVYAVPAKGKALSLYSAKCLNLMLGVAGGQGFDDRTYSIPKRELRRNHKGNERIRDAIEELSAVQFKIATTSPRGKAAMMTAALLTSTIEELDDDPEGADDDRLVYFRFTPEFIEIHRHSRLWAALSGPTMVRFDSYYALKLYEVGCQIVGRDDPVLRLTVPELRDLLHVESGRYGDWAQLRRKTLDVAIAEVNQLAHFEVNVPEDRIRRAGRKVIGLELRFRPKTGTAAEDAQRERDRHRTGRKARRTGAVEDVSVVAVGADDPVRLWSAARGLVERDPAYRRQAPERWLGHLALSHIDGNKMHLVANSAMVAQHVGQYLDQALISALKRASGLPIDSIDITVGKEISSSESKD